MFGRFRKKEKGLQAVDNRGWLRILEPFGGAWQRNIEIKRDNVLSFFAVFSCLSLISSDIAKMPILYKRRDSDGIWTEQSSKDYSRLLKKPNKIQNRIQFLENWTLSKFTTGNTFILKVKNSKGIIEQLRILDPNRVIPLLTESGDVYYQLNADNVTGVEKEVTVPASEIIHDRFNCLFHPLVGLSPIFACGLSATHGLKIQENSTQFFQNGGRPGGVLLVPGNLSEAAATKLKQDWNSGYSGENAGRTAILADGMKYEQFTITASDAQTVEQLKLTAQIVCAVFHVPEYKIGLGGNQTVSNTEALDRNYYSQCLQSHIESIEVLLDEAFDLSDNEGFELDLKALLRMDTSTRYKSHSDAIGGGWMSPNEARKSENMRPVTGGDSPLMQQQNYSLEALAKRDAQQDPFNSTQLVAQQPEETIEEDIEDTAKLMALIMTKELSHNEI